MKIVYFLVLSFFCIGCELSHAQPSGLDSSFGINGEVTYAPPSGYAAQYDAVTIQPNGKIVVAGLKSGQAILARYFPNGNIDSSFATNGMYTRAYETLGFWPKSIAMLSNGKILTGGDRTQKFSLLRFKSNGQVDSAFGIDGIITTTTGSKNSQYDMALQSDGKIILMGTALTGAGDAIAMIRFDSLGVRDSTFGINGQIVNFTGGYGASPGAMMLQPDGKILIATQAYNSQQISSFACLRYTSAGIIDTTFNHTGIVFGANGFLTYVKAIVLQPDGKIILGGAIDGELVLQRFLGNGAIDSGFGMNGIAAADTCVASCMALRSNGSIVVGGYTTANNEDWAVMQFKPNGTLDSSFGQYGKIFTPIGVKNERMLDIKLQTDGKALACGWSDRTTPNESNAIITRYHSDGRLIIPQLHTGINPDITLYPLPVSDLLYINAPVNAAITDALLYGIDGRSIAHLPVNNSTLNVAGFPNGLYLLRLQFTPSFSPIIRKIIIHH
ncbi:hypothetical protein [Chitinophaga eiseniae]|uniref:Delta-60 repeat domain-containing protein/Por secretion system C-terminal sorting domain-containing protein n=1 Tax=Chitinophaga eiseniae TaxID=634771 RepID=A0A847SVP4_9BACT|nr:hypothetical protein [Chitinophaga eiseniae]NLR82246.1 hypothetical protein [Chitinophaga eiseniae]